MTPGQVLIALTVPTIWGMGFVVAKGALEGFPPILLMALRFALTATALVWFVRMPREIWGRLLFISVFAVTIQYSLTFTGLKAIDASTAVLFVQLEVPFMVVIAALFLGERVTVTKILGIVVAFVGVGLIAGAPNLQGQLKPLVILVTGVLFFSIGQVMVRKLKYNHGFSLIAWMAVFATPQLFLASWLIEGDPTPHLQGATPIVWIAVVYLGLVMTAVGYGLWYRLLAVQPVPTVAPFLLLLPVVSVIGSVIFLGEVLPMRTIIGGVIVMAGVSVIVFEEWRSHQNT